MLELRGLYHKIGVELNAKNATLAILRKLETDMYGTNAVLPDYGMDIKSLQAMVITRAFIGIIEKLNILKHTEMVGDKDRNV